MNEPEGAAKFLRQVWFVIGFEKEIVALWESGRPGVGFPLSMARRGCGNVGIAQRFPRTVGRVENLLLVFQAFHGPSLP